LWEATAVVDQAGDAAPRTPIVVTDTTVAHVTFFEDRAEVSRIVRCRVPKGNVRVHARGISLLVDDRSVACKTSPSAITIVSTRIRRKVEETIEGSAEEIVALENECDELRTRLTALDRQLARAGTDRRRASALLEQWARTIETVPSRAEAAATELDRAHAGLDVLMTESFDAQARLLEQKDETQRSLGRADMRLDQARARKPRYEAFAEIELLVADAGTAEGSARSGDGPSARRPENGGSETEIAIELVYRTPCALWRPEHRARLVRKENGHGEITVTTFATVWQCTGEVWKDVSCRFSTARPTSSASAPHLREDVLSTRKKTDAERRQIVVEARDQAIATAGVVTLAATQDVDEMPGVEDGGEALWLTGRSHATIDSDGRPVRVEVSERAFPCTLARVCYPELGSAAHLRATATWPGPAPLLAGPATIGRETEIVGRSVVKFVGPGEPFELGFGVDDGLSVRRRVIEKRKTAQVVGTQHVARQVLLYVSNASGEPRSLSLIERVPVSEVEDVKIEIERQNKTPMRHDARDGFATFELEVPPRATRDIVLEYRIEAKSNVVLPVFDPSGVDA
jgi:hypothetical protein